MDWNTMLSYISGSVDEELLLRNRGTARHLTQAVYAAIEHPGTIILPDVLRRMSRN